MNNTDNNNFNSESIYNIVEDLEAGKPINETDVNLLESFLNKCISNNEQGIINSEQFQFIFDLFYNYSKNSNNFINNNIKSIIDRYDNVLNSTKNVEKDNVMINKNNVKTLKYEIKLNDKEKISGFIVTSIILQSTLILGFILSLLSLVKK